MSKDIVDAIASGDNLGAESQFKNAIQTKVGAALEKRREEVLRASYNQRKSTLEDQS